jgi:hypothetical protein
MPVIPFWLKIVGPLVLLALVFGGLAAWGNGKFRAGKAEGVEQTDKKWEEATAKLRQQATQSASRADDLAVKRLEEFEAQAEDEQAAVDKAVEEGRSPFDALFN